MTEYYKPLSSAEPRGSELVVFSRGRVGRLEGAPVLLDPEAWFLEGLAIERSLEPQGELVRIVRGCRTIATVLLDEILAVGRFPTCVFVPPRQNLELQLEHHPRDYGRRPVELRVYWRRTSA